MARRHLSSVLLIALVAAACSPSESMPDTTPASSVTTSAPAEPIRLEYRYGDGETLRYEVEVGQSIGFRAQGDAAGLGGTELPIDADLVTESQGTTTYTARTNSDGQSDLEISARFPDTRVAGNVNGRTIDNLAEGGIEADLARIDPVDVVVTVEPTGRILGAGNPTGVVVGAELAALTGLTSEMFTVPIGPVLPPNREVGVGDSWETMTSRPGQNGPVAILATSRIVASTDGLLEIHTTTVTDGYEVDFSREFRDLFLGFAELEEEGEVPPEVIEQIDSIEFRIVVPETTTVEQSHFDPGRGVVRRSIKTTGLRLTMVFRSPSETGELTGFEIVFDLTQSATFTLID
ncbi:MAG TPA: hypothetical protein VLB67_13750 [Acidimicrobiia bacterium]|nr:hypothetical protein [Acidimicrobiia bacterium]